MKIIKVLKKRGFWKMRKHFKYDAEKMKAVVTLHDSKTGLNARGVTVAHEDDADFATEKVGLNIAEMKAHEVMYMKKAKHQLNKAEQLRKQADVLEAAGALNIVKSVDLEKYRKNYVNNKDTFFRKIESNRETPYEPTDFEQLGDLTKDLSIDAKAEIAKQIMEGGKK